jgi:hypothetical protein
MRPVLPLLLLPFASCKVPIFDVEAGFELADASWFAEEETLFVFYDVRAEQGIEEPSVIEITYATDDERVPWTAVTEFETVHTHIPVDCGQKARCGSVSIRVPIEPREVDVRLRYHPDGELALDADTLFNVVGPGPPHTNRSLLIYGVFEETNQRVQWRSRHRFPTLRNEQVTLLGLRREFSVRDQRYGTAPLVSNNNPYGYGVTCPDGFTVTNVGPVQTDTRAVFSTEDLPLDASGAALVCAESTVTDARGTFVASAVAQKNPEVRSAFPVLRSPVREATTLAFFLAPCNRTISEEHEEMQRQRLLVDDLPAICTDDWQSQGFVDSLVVQFRDAVEAERPSGRDMVLVVGVHQDEAGVAAAVEEALAQVVPDERHRSSPRLAGAFVFDSTARGLTEPSLAQATLWCPSTISFDQIPDASARSCPILPDIPDFNLGPFTFGTLPILPTREQYLDFIETYSVAQAGDVEELTFLAPEFAVTSDHVDFGTFGVATFLNGEAISAEPDDAFSFCVQEEPQLFVFRSARMQNPQFLAALQFLCALGAVPAEVCLAAEAGLLPIELLPLWHNLLGETDYELGVFWEFPFLLRMNYRAVVAGSVGAFGLSVPFGLGSPAQSYYGTEIWLDEEFSIDPSLAHCRRFCDHPTFDSAGVYHVTDPFRQTYQQNCYLPDFPEPGDLGFPLDP